MILHNPIKVKLVDQSSMESSITIDIIWDADEDQPPDFDPDPFLCDLAQRLDLNEVECSLLVTSDERVRALNSQYRQKDKTTDVLSFPNPPIPGYDGPRHLGDIVISFPQTVRQAADIGQPVNTELRFLILHGLLHLLGYDHEVDNGEMLELQSKLKRELEHYF